MVEKHLFTSELDEYGSQTDRGLVRLSTVKEGIKSKLKSLSSSLWVSKSI